MLYTAVSTEGLFKSVDAGANWTKLAALQFSQFSLGTSLSGRAYVQSLVIDFANSNIL